MVNALISIIIPTNNAEKTLKNCVDSIIAQKYLRKEIWIIDNESIDDTIKIVKEYVISYPNINYISEKDKGVYDAMNKGIKLAKGDWLYFLGCEDTFFSENILSGMFTGSTNINKKIIYGNVKLNGNNGWAKDGTIYDGHFNLKKILSKNISHQSIFYHRDVFKRLGLYNLKYPLYADYDFNLRCFANYKFYYEDTVIANFSFGGLSTLHGDEIFSVDKNKNIIKYFLNDLFSSSFIDHRLYVYKAAFSKTIDVNIITRLYCSVAYIKLKIHSFLK